MRADRFSRRGMVRGGLLAGALVAGVALGACGGDDSTGSVGTTSSAPATSADAAFPVTVEDQFGSVTISEAPERIVAMTNRDADTLLALGVIPVAIHSRYDFATGVGPWATAALGDATPTVWNGPEFDYEAVASAAPDLILYTASGGDQEIHDALSAIAPVIDLPIGALPWGTTPEQSTRLIADALGRHADGEALLADFDAYLAAQAAAHPVFASRTVNYLDVYPGGISSYAADHIINSMMYDVGFQPIANSDLPDGNSSVAVSAENVADYDADILIVYPFGRTLEELVQETPTLVALDSYTHDRLFVLQDLALSNSSILSIPYALDALLPQFDAALSAG